MKNKIKYTKNDFTDPVRKKTFNKKLFQIVAPKYQLVTRGLSFFQDQLWKKTLISQLPVSDQQSCLDLACGTGDITLLLGKKYPQSKIIGLDLTEEMVIIAKNRTSLPNIDYQIGNMNQLTFPDSSFSIITGGYALRNSPDLNITLKEIGRVLQKEGIGVFLEFRAPHQPFLRKMKYLLLRFWGSLWGMLLHGNPHVYAYIAESLKHFPDNQKFKKMLENCGFKNIRFLNLFFGFVSLIYFEK
ncbi:MAG: ubiquinone/menaquinone biosynthesis methyltransferase [Spirochaetes bacterium]|nr:ubiquinone/menaquinone biosynthesis methyltransferase [Spirochaetota bacterium]